MIVSCEEVECDHYDEKYFFEHCLYFVSVKVYHFSGTVSKQTPFLQNGKGVEKTKLTGAC